MADRADHHAGTADAARYAIRQVGAGWTVYDFRNLEPVRIFGRLQIGLDREAAQSLADYLSLAAHRRAPIEGQELPEAA